MEGNSSCSVLSLNILMFEKFFVWIFLLLLFLAKLCNSYGSMDSKKRNYSGHGQQDKISYRNRVKMLTHDLKFEFSYGD